MFYKNGLLQEASFTEFDIQRTVHRDIFL